MKDFFSYYEILGVEETAGLKGIKKAYRSKAMQYHPDRVPEHLKKKNEEIFKQISEAYQVLSDPEKRKQYDEGLKNLRVGQSFDQADYSGNPVLQVDKTSFEFKNLKWGTVVSDSFYVSNAGNGILIGTIKALMGWVVLSEDTIDTPDAQEIGITIDTADLLAGQGYSETIEIQTNGGNETVYVDISTEAVSNADVIISLIRSVVCRHRLKVSVLFCTIIGFWILGNSLGSYHKRVFQESAPAANPAGQVNYGEGATPITGNAMNYPAAPPPAKPRGFILEFRPVIVVRSGYGFPIIPGRRFYGGRNCHTRGWRH